MQLTPYLFKKIVSEIRIIYITDTKPKQKIRLNPIDPEDINIDLNVISRWSPNNKELYQLLLNNGMAEFICNRQFLNQFYEVLVFMYSGIMQINSAAISLVNLKVLNLFHNNIRNIQNIPPNCRELYLDYNAIDQCSIKNVSNLELLSLSHNSIIDQVLCRILKKTPNLRALNISFNRISDIRGFVSNLQKYTIKVKILVAYNNPISMLWPYWDYITEEIALDLFDNQKYVKPEPELEQVKEQKPVEQKKQEKKDSKNAKKGAKGQQKPPEPEPKKMKIREPRVRNQEDYQKVTLKIQSGTLEGFSGVIYDSTLFPQDNLDLAKTMTTFWLQLSAIGQKISSQNDKIKMDSITIEEESNRLQFPLNLSKNLGVNSQNLSQFDKGITLYIYKEEPKVQTDPETGEQKVQIKDDKIVMIQQCIGGCYLDIRKLHKMRNKKIQKRLTVFVKEAVDSPLFKRPYENEEELIKKKKIQFETNLAKIEEQKLRNIEEEEAAKAAKKGGKDSKKAADKKAAKKEGKQALVTDKKFVPKCNFQKVQKEYCYIQDQKMFKCLNNHLLSITITMQ